MIYISKSDKETSSNPLESTTIVEFKVSSVDRGTLIEAIGNEKPSVAKEDFSIVNKVKQSMEIHLQIQLELKIHP
jgi:hypothetical protein